MINERFLLIETCIRAAVPSENLQVDYYSSEKCDRLSFTFHGMVPQVVFDEIFDNRLYLVENNIRYFMSVDEARNSPLLVLKFYRYK